MLKAYTVKLFFKNKLSNIDKIKKIRDCLIDAELLSDDVKIINDDLDPELFEDLIFLKKDFDNKDNNNFSLKLSPSSLSCCSISTNKDNFNEKLSSIYKNVIEKCKIDVIKFRNEVLISVEKSNVKIEPVKTILNSNKDEWFFRFKNEDGYYVSYDYIRNSEEEKFFLSCDKDCKNTDDSDITFEEIKTEIFKIDNINYI